MGFPLPRWGSAADLERPPHPADPLRPRGTGLDPNAELQTARNCSDGL